MNHEPVTLEEVEAVKRASAKAVRDAEQARVAADLKAGKRGAVQSSITVKLRDLLGRA